MSSQKTMFLFVAAILGSFASSTIMKVPISRVSTSSTRTRPTSSGPGVDGCEGDMLINHVVNHYSLFTERYHTLDAFTLPLDWFAFGSCFVNITIGTSSTVFQVLLDTTNPFLWVPGFDCSSQIRRETIDQDQQVLPNGRSFSFPLSCKDSIHIGGLTITNQPFAAQSTPGQISFDGVLGLGYYASERNHSTSVLYNLMDQGLLDEPIFALYLSVHKHKDSEITLGGINSHHFFGRLTKLTLSRDDAWVVEFTTVTLGSQSLHLNASGALFDSATSFIGLPSLLADILNEAIGPVSCDRRKTLPDLVLNLAGHNFSISPYDYIAQIDDECKSVILGLDLPSPFSQVAVLGTPFLRRWYSVYDWTHASVSLAASA